jgi:hypothetical protein
MITLAMGISLWSSFCALNRTRYAGYADFWVAASFSASVLGVPVYRVSGPADWALPGWRFLAVLIAGVLAILSGVLFPVTARSVAQRRLAAALADLGGLCSRLQTQVRLRAQPAATRPTAVPRLFCAALCTCPGSGLGCAACPGLTWPAPACRAVWAGRADGPAGGARGCSPG